MPTSVTTTITTIHTRNKGERRKYKIVLLLKLSNFITIQHKNVYMFYRYFYHVRLHIRQKINSLR